MRRPALKIQNLNKAYRLNEAFIKSLALEILKYIKKTKQADLEVVFLNDKAIRTINKRYRTSDRSTDVLSFRIDRREFGEDRFLGEIFISSDRAFENSKVFKTKFEEELTLYVIHGILHLFGYDDQSAKERLEMSKRETGILDYLCRQKNLSKVLMPR